MKLNPNERIAGNVNNILKPRFHKTEKRTTPLKTPTEEDTKKHLRVIHTFSSTQINDRDVFVLV